MANKNKLKLFGMLKEHLYDEIDAYVNSVENLISDKYLGMFGKNDIDEIIEEYETMRSEISSSLSIIKDSVTGHLEDDSFPVNSILLKLGLEE